MLGRRKWKVLLCDYPPCSLEEMTGVIMKTLCLHSSFMLKGLRTSKMVLSAALFILTNVVSATEAEMG